MSGACVGRARRIAATIVHQLPKDLSAYEVALIGATIAGIGVGSLASGGGIVEGKAGAVLDGLRTIIEHTAEEVALS